ncbi:MAG TPA: DUF502 domain-containing protein [Alphaproteobacteria bacterium]|nr:DUF502 domain-containing protein [Alphaproteobacteria bacterium]
MGFGARLRAYFFAGILVTAPVAITLYLAWLFISFIDDRVNAILPARFNPETYLPFSLPGLGVLLVVVVLVLIGAMAAGFLGRLIVRAYEGVLARIPAVRSVYGAVKQIFETVLANQSNAFREVVLVEYPRRGLWALGFITGTTQGEVQNLTEDDVINVFLPTTPNPTSGFLLFVPRKDLVVLQMTVEEGIKMVVSGGIVTPPDRRPEKVRATPEIPAVLGDIRSPATDNEVVDDRQRVVGRSRAQR